MKKIIGGKRYDTITAKEMGRYQFWNRNDSKWLEETLYKKKTGEFFLYGEGGSNSKYGIEASQSNWRITPLSVKEAMKWAENHLKADEYEAIFGEVNEDGEMPGKVQVSFWVTEGQRREAQELGVTHAEVYAAGLKALDEK